MGLWPSISQLVSAVLGQPRERWGWLDGFLAVRSRAERPSSSPGAAADSTGGHGPAAASTPLSLGTERGSGHRGAQLTTSTHRSQGWSQDL